MEFDSKKIQDFLNGNLETKSEQAHIPEKNLHWILEFIDNPKIMEDLLDLNQSHLAMDILTGVNTDTVFKKTANVIFDENHFLRLQFYVSKTKMVYGDETNVLGTIKLYNVVSKEHVLLATFHQRSNVNIFLTNLFIKKNVARILDKTSLNASEFYYLMMEHIKEHHVEDRPKRYKINRLTCANQNALLKCVMGSIINPEKPILKEEHQEPAFDVFLKIFKIYKVVY